MFLTLLRFGWGVVLSFPLGVDWVIGWFRSLWQYLGLIHIKCWTSMLKCTYSISYSRLADLSPSLSRSQIWNPMLGLINDLRDDRATIPAAALSRVWVLRFVCLPFDHHGFVRLLKRAIRAAAFRSLDLSRHITNKYLEVSRFMKSPKSFTALFVSVCPLLKDRSYYVILHNEICRGRIMYLTQNAKVPLKLWPVEIHLVPRGVNRRLATSGTCNI